MIEGVGEQPAEPAGAAVAHRAPAVVQAEADEAQAAHGHAEEQQIVLLLRLVPASLGNDGRRRPIISKALSWGESFQ